MRRLVLRFVYVTAALVGPAACGSSGSGSGTGFPDATASRADGGASSGVKGHDGGGSLKPTSTPTCTASSLDHTGCPCTGTQTTSCYTGPAATRNIGACHDGSQRCQTSGEFSTFSSCVGEVLPSASDACSLAQDAAPPPRDAAPPPHDAGTPPHDAGTPPPRDASGAIAIVGEACTPGSVQQTTQTETCNGGLSCGCSTNGCSCTCSGSGSMATTMQEVFFCDSSGVWNLFPSGSCNATTCAACLQANCAHIVPAEAGSACATAMAEGLAWLGACGPDRATYFSMLSAACLSGGGEDLSIQLEECKDQKCLGASAACSNW